MPVVMLDSLVQTVQRPVVAPQAQFLARLWICLSLYDRCVVRWCSKLWLSHSCMSSKVVDFRAAETAPHGPTFSEDHRVSSVVCCLVVDAPVMQVVFMPVVVRQARMVQTLLYSVEAPQLQFLHGCGRPCDPAETLGCVSQVPRTQFIAGVWTFLIATVTGTHSCSCARQALFGRPGGGDEGSLLQFCRTYRPPSIWTLRPRVAGTPGV